MWKFSHWKCFAAKFPQRNFRRRNSMWGNLPTENVMRRNFLAAKYPSLKHQNAPRTLKYATYSQVRHLPSNTLRTLKYPRYAVCSVPAYPVLFLVRPVRSLRTGYADICHVTSVVRRNIPSWNTEAKQWNASRALKYATYPQVPHLPSNTLRTLKYPRYAVCSVPAYPVLFLVSPVRSLRTRYADICHVISVVRRNLPSWNTTGETSKSMKL